jgi:hypothetical protein
LPSSWRFFRHSSLKLPATDFSIGSTALGNFFRRSPREVEARETRDLYARVRARYEASPTSAANAEREFAAEIAYVACERVGAPSDSCLADYVYATTLALCADEPVLFRFPPVPDAALGPADGVVLRNFLRRKEQFLGNADAVLARWRDKVIDVFEDILSSLPATTFEPQTNDAAPDFLAVSLIDLCQTPAEAIERLIFAFFADEVYDPGLFAELRRVFDHNLLIASGIPPDEASLSRKPTILPTEAKEKSPQKLADTYLAGTPFGALLAAPVPFAIPPRTRFEHHWIVAGSGHGKTQTLQYLIAKDLELVARGQASIVVIDSQRQLIPNIARLKIFAEGEPLSGRLVHIDPTDIAYPVALNLFDINMERIDRYSALDREMILNSALELYEFILNALLGAELTSRQATLFQFVVQALLHIPNATIHTLRELMEPGGYERFKPHIDKLDGTARAFFETQFNSKQFAQTREQVVVRVFTILRNRTLERLFSHPRSKLDLFAEMNSGKVILIDTAKSLLKESGTTIFGRFFIALIAQAAIERATLPEHQRLPCFVYVDEAADYFDQHTDLILREARKQKIGMVLAHQILGDLTPDLQQTFASNTSIRFAGGVGDRDARGLAHDLRTTPEFILGQPQLSFAAFIRNVTPQAISMRFPLGYMEAMPQMTDAEAQIVRDEMRRRYAVLHLEHRSAVPEEDRSADLEPKVLLPVAQRAIAKNPEDLASEEY